MGLVASQHVGFSWTRAQTYVPCIGRQILNHCATREVPEDYFFIFDFLQFEYDAQCSHCCFFKSSFCSYQLDCRICVSITAWTPFGSGVFISISSTLMFTRTLSV